MSRLLFRNGRRRRTRVALSGHSLFLACALAAMVPLSACGDEVETPGNLTAGAGASTSSTIASTSAMTSSASTAGGEGGSMESCNDAEIDGIFALTPDLDRGAELFEKSCGKSTCHGPDGVSGNGPDFVNVLPKYDDCGQMKIMLKGKKGMISLNLIYMSDQDFRDALAYVRETFPF